MDPIYTPTGELLGQLGPAASAVEAAADTVTGLNKLAAQVGEVATAPLEEVAREHLSREQAAAFRELLEAQERIPYGELLQRGAQTLAWLDDIETRASAINRGDFDEAGRVHADAQELAALIPALTERLGETADEEIRRLQVVELGKLGHERTSAERILARLREAMGKVGALPLPVLLGGDERRRIAGEVQAQLAQPTGKEVTEADTFPVEASRLTNAQLGEQVRRRHPEHVFIGASEFLARLLAEDPGRVYTYIELGEMMYPNDPDMAKGRVSTLLSAYQAGRIKTIKRVLADSGLVLQRGLRTRYGPDGKPIGMRRAVYRAVPVSEPASERPAGNGEHDAGWQVIATADNE